MKIDIQEFYEDILSSHWQKVAQLKELIVTSTGSQLRLKSINDRKKELEKIEKQKTYIEFLFKDELIVPDWYYQRFDELKNIFGK